VKEFLSERNVEFTEYNVEDDKEARRRMTEISGHTTVPTTVVDNEVVIGFDPGKLAKLLH